MLCDTSNRNFEACYKSRKQRSESHMLLPISQYFFGGYMKSNGSTVPKKTVCCSVTL